MGTKLNKNQQLLRANKAMFEFKVPEYNSDSSFQFHLLKIFIKVEFPLILEMSQYLIFFIFHEKKRCHEVVPAISEENILCKSKSAGRSLKTSKTCPKSQGILGRNRLLFFPT